MTWEDAVRAEMDKYQKETGSSRFSLQEFYEFSGDRLAAKYPNNDHVEAKIRQILQRLRDQGELEFVDDQGTYRIRDAGGEQTDEEILELLADLEAELEDG